MLIAKLRNPKKYKKCLIIFGDVINKQKPNSAQNQYRITQ